MSRFPYQQLLTGCVALEGCNNILTLQTLRQPDSKHTASPQQAQRGVHGEERPPARRLHSAVQQRSGKGTIKCKDTNLNDAERAAEVTLVTHCLLSGEGSAVEQ